MENIDVERLGDELLEEFKKLEVDYPHITKMFMDMVSIVSQQNDQINAISRAMQDVVSDDLREDDRVVSDRRGKEASACCIMVMEKGEEDDDVEHCGGTGYNILGPRGGSA